MKVIPARKTDKLFLKLRWVAALSALAGLGAIVFHVTEVLPMPQFIIFLGTPALILLCASAALAKKLNAKVFYRNLLAGAGAGLIATIIYDLVRYFFLNVVNLEYNAFQPIYIFGGWITNSHPDSLLAAYAGWLYHYWNGISFGIFYALTFPARHWIYGFIYGIMMEGLMLALFPYFLQIVDMKAFLSISLIAHIFYGVMLGWCCRRYTISWKTH